MYNFTLNNKKTHTVTFIFSLVFNFITPLHQKKCSLTRHLYISIGSNKSFLHSSKYKIKSV